jgi:hypothetical protein
MPYPCQLPYSARGRRDPEQPVPAHDRRRGLAAARTTLRASRVALADLGGGAVRLLNKNSGKVAEVFQFSSADGAAIDQWTVNGGANQIWQMTTP